MTLTVPTCVPASLVAGTTWQFRLSYADFPASDGAALALYFRGVGTLDATADNSRVEASGDDFLVTIAAADTTLVAGVYRWFARATLDGVVYSADEGTVVVEADPATAAAGALQSHAEVMLAALEAEIAARVSGAGTAVESHGALGRNIQLVPLADLYVMRNKYAAEVARERNGGKLPPVVIRFGGPSGP